MGKIDAQIVGDNAGSITTGSLSGTLAKSALGVQAVPAARLTVAALPKASATPSLQVSTDTLSNASGGTSPVGATAPVMATSGTTTTTISAVGAAAPLSAAPVTDVIIGTTVNTSFMATLPADIQPAINQLTSLGTEWAYKDASGHVVVSYSFSTSASYDYSSSREAGGFSAFSAAQQAAARQALASWAEVADITFTEVDGNNGSIRFANTTTGPDVAWAYRPGSGTGGDVWINPNYSTNQTLTVGSYGLQTMTHEIGHALGLNHAGDYNGASAPEDSTGQYDTRLYSIMSYYDDDTFGGLYAAAPALHDIAAIQAIYGANTTTRAGDTVYSWADKARVVQAIWDAGGVDTIDASNQWTSNIINLNSGSFSSIGLDVYGRAARNNVAIAYGAMIENATTGSGNDVLTGNSVANVLIAGAGNDTLFGGAGNDLLEGGTGADLYGFETGSGVDTVADDGGVSTIWLEDGFRAEFTYTVSGSSLLVDRGSDRIVIQNYVGNESQFVFRDNTGTFSPFPANWAPFTAATAVSPVGGGLVGLDRIFSVSDRNGDAITQYRVRDTSAGSVAGWLVYGGNALAAGSWLTFSGQLSDVQLQTLARGSVDSIELQAFDGKEWGNVATNRVVASATIANNVPLVAARGSGSFAAGTKVMLKDIFAVSDADGDAITKYRVTDGSTAGGSIYTAAGVELKAGEAVELTAAEFAGAYYLNPDLPASQTVTVQAFDARDWSAALSRTITTTPGPDELARFANNLGWLYGTALTASGTVGSSDDPQDWYCFNLSSASQVSINLSTLSGNADLRLYEGADVRVIAGSDLTGTATDSLSASLRAGTYYLRIYGGEASSYTLSVAASGTATGSNSPYLLTPVTNKMDGWAGQSLKLDELFKGRDRDSVLPSTYRMRVSGGSSKFDFGGWSGMTTDANGWVTWNNQYALTYTTLKLGTADVSETLEMQASDGTSWSNLGSVTINTHATGSDPLRAAATQLGSVGHAQSFSGQLAAGETRWYNFTMGASATLYYKLSGTDTDVDVSLYKGDGRTFGDTMDAYGSGSGGSYMLAAGDYSIKVMARDGTTPFTFTFGTNSAPSFSVIGSTRASVGNSVTLDKVLAFSDPDGDTNLRFTIIDKEVGGGYLVYKGVKLEETWSYPFTPDDLANLSYVFGASPGKGTLSIRVLDDKNAGSTDTLVTMVTLPATGQSSASWSDQVGLGTGTSSTPPIVAANSSLERGLLAAV